MTERTDGWSTHFADGYVKVNTHREEQEKRESDAVESHCIVYAGDCDSTQSFGQDILKIIKCSK